LRDGCRGSAEAGAVLDMARPALTIGGVLRPPGRTAMGSANPNETATGADGIHELTEDLSASPFYSHDMAPTTRAARKWGLQDIAALWISMSACIPTYMLASSLIAEGMNWWQAVLTIFLGNAVVLVPMVLNAHAGTKYGIPFPVYCRASFGIL